MSLLENELVKKYFGYAKCYWNGETCVHNVCRSEMILVAMQEPIKAGDRFLEMCNFLPGDPAVLEKAAHDGDGFNFKEEFHPWLLRLPPAHQKKECGCICHNAKENHNCCPDMNHSKTKPAPEPEKCGCPPGILGHCHDPKCPHPAHVLEKSAPTFYGKSVPEMMEHLRDETVEHQIYKIKVAVNPCGMDLDKELRALVRLAREG